MADIVKKLTIRTTVEGAAETQRDLKGVQSAYEGVAKAAESTATVTDKVSRSGLSTAEAYRRQTLALDESARAQDRMARATKVADQFLAQGGITAKEHAERLELIRNKYSAVGAAAVQGVGLARHEMVNLSRQAQDLAVSLGSGQSFGTVLLQQGTQIADVFANSTGSLRGFFGQVVSGAATVLTPIRVVAAGVAGLAAGAVLAVNSFVDGQTDITKALQGIGRASGVTRDAINAIGADASSMFGLSIKEARAFASTLAATGQIGRQEIETITKRGHDLAATLGVDSTEAAKMLAAAFADPVKGVDTLASRLGMVTDLQRQSIMLAAEQGRKAEAQLLLQRAIEGSIGKASELTSIWVQGWTAVSNIASNVVDQTGKILSNSLKIAQTPQQKLADVEGQARGDPLAGVSVPRLMIGDPTQISKLIDNLTRGEEGFRKLTQSAAGLMAEIGRPELDRMVQTLADASVRAGDFERSINPIEGRIRELTAGIENMRKVLESSAPELLTSDVGGMQRALAEAEQMRAAAQATRAEVQGLQAEYGGVSQQTAIVLANQNAQLAVASAVTGQERMAAQEIATALQLRLQGVAASEAAAIAAGQRSIAEAQINASARDQLAALQDQFAVASAVTVQQQIQAQGAATTNALLRQGVDAYTAQAIGAQQVANAQAQINASAQGLLAAARDQFAVASASSEQERIMAEQHARFNELVRSGVDEGLADQISAQEASNKEARLAQREWEEHARAREQEEREILQRQNQMRANEIASINAWEELERKINAVKRAYAFVPFGANTALYGSSFEFEEGKNIWNRGGTFSQFNPAGYTSDMGGILPANLAAAGLGGVAMMNGVIGANAEGLTSIVDNVFKRGGSIMDAINKVIAAGPIDSASSGVLSNLTNLLPETERASVIEREIAALRAEPVTLARETLIKQLTDSLDQLKSSTDNLSSTMQSILSPIYTTDPRLTNLGFRADTQPLTYDPFAQPVAGFQHGGEFTVPGGYSANDNTIVRFAARSGEQVKVTPPGQGDGDQRPIQITQNIYMMGNDRSAARETGFQAAQQARRALASVR